MVHVQPRENDDEETEDGCKPPLIEIRVTVASCQRTRALIDYELRDHLENSNAIFNRDSRLPIIPSAQAMYEEEILEATFKIRYGQAYHTVREASILLARDWCKTIGHGLHEAYRLEFMSPDSYLLSCTPEHRDIAIHAFSLGSFRNYGLFDEHFRAKRIENVDVDSMLDFEHDCKRMDLYCMYETIVPVSASHSNYRQRIKSDSMILMCRLTFQYASIHSIVVDYSADYDDSASVERTTIDYDGRATVVYFRLKYPPKIHAGWAKTETARKKAPTDMTYYDLCIKNRRACYYERVRELLDCKSDVIGKCNVLKVILTPEAVNANRNDPQNPVSSWHTKVNEIISRVKSRASCRVYFTGIQTNPCVDKGITVSDNWLSSFECSYLLRALLSTRTYNVRNQINETFLSYARQCVLQNERAAEIALSQLLAAADENRYFSVFNAFRKVFEIYANEAVSITTAPNARNPRKQLGVGSSLEDDEMVGKNCVKVRKLVVTPTREMLLAPEVIVSNRILREFGEEYALRVVIRDEDGQKLQGSRMKNDILKQWLDKLMREEYVIGGRRYKFLGWSNSQLRDHAFYMYATTADGSDVRTIRRWMGDFTAIQNVPKLMSRMGQCFTQAQKTLVIPWNGGEIAEEDDITGGDFDPRTGEPYVFSDGIGRISLKYAQEVCDKLEVVPIRSAYQIRYAGFKGMLSVDPELDKNPSGPQVMLRKSMHKFESDKSHVLEVVKYSQPSPVYLNRPLVMILDQISEKSLRSRPFRPSSTGAPGAVLLSENVHRRVCNRIHDLLDEELFSMADMLLEEKVSANALSTRTTLNINFKALKDAGFTLTTEPFFRGMLLAIHQYTIKQQLWKQKIEVPPNLGRTMYGVLDTTRLLQYGQVFVRYSKHLNKPGDDLIILEGDVMVTKNPCIVPGDVRILKAVDIPQLHHMLDVIVFPQNGPRPHTDEMAGSDLDGDEYSVYWDPNMMFDPRQVQQPMHFPKNKPTDVEGGVQDDHMIDFFRHYLQQDSIGQVSNAHLAFADKDGIFSRRAMNIAIKCSMAVDFPKTGVPAEPLTDDERPYHWPDFFEKYHQPMYRSQRLVGKLYRRVKNASDIIRLGQDSISRPSADRFYFDAHLEVRGWESYREDALLLRDQYNQYLQMLLDQYGVTDESGLISGHMVTIRNRLSDGEKEDFSFFNTEKIIEWRINKINSKFRYKFFEEFGGENDQILERPDEEMQQKASAWYMVTYGLPQTIRGRVMLSFPWTVWEVLRYVKLKRTFDLYALQVEERVVDPTAELLNKTIEEYCLRCNEDMQRLINMIRTAESHNSESVVLFYLDMYSHDLPQLLAAMLHWVEKEMGFEKENSLKPNLSALLLVDFCLRRQFFEKKAVIERQAAEEQRRITGKRLVSKGVILLEFLKYLASFKNRDTIETLICDDEATIHVRRRQLWYVGQVAFKTYHHVAWTNRFDSLHLQNESRLARAALAWDREETEAITVVLESTVTNRITKEVVEKRFKEWSGVHDVHIRHKMSKDADEYLVTAAGTLEARQALHEILLSENLQECLLDNVNPLFEQEVN